MLLQVLNNINVNGKLPDNFKILPIEKLIMRKRVFWKNTRPQNDMFDEVYSQVTPGNFKSANWKEIKYDHQNTAIQLSSLLLET